MPFLLQPWHILVAAVGGLVNQRQQRIIEFQNDQIEALQKKLGKKRLLLTDDQRRVLVVKDHALDRKAWSELTTIVTPDTILRWHREFVAREWDHSEKRRAVGRPRIRQVIVDLTVQFAKENPTWGYDRIQEALSNVGYHIADSTVANILKVHGIEAAPGRQRMLRVELVRDRDSMEPATTEALDVLKVAKERGLLLGKGVLSSNTLRTRSVFVLVDLRIFPRRSAHSATRSINLWLRIKPPMCITKADADFVVDCLDEVLPILGKQSCGE